MTKYDVWTFDLNSLYDEKPRADVVAHRECTMEEAAKLVDELSDYQTAAWVTVHGEPNNIVNIRKIIQNSVRDSIKDAKQNARIRFPEIANFTFSDSWGCPSDKNPNPTYCCFDDDDIMQDNCLYCGQPEERK